MTCDEAEILLPALIDGELDASHAREVETHAAQCPHCTASLAIYRQMSHAIASADLRYSAPQSLRLRIEAALPKPTVVAIAAPSRRAVLRGFALGSGVSATPRPRCSRLRCATTIWTASIPRSCPPICARCRRDI